MTARVAVATHHLVTDCAKGATEHDRRKLPDFAAASARNRRTLRTLTQHHSLEDPMRKILLALAATAVMAAPMATVVKAEDSTTVIKRDGDRKTVIKKEHDLNVVPVPHEEEHTTIIKKEHD
jgi:hypothetical protein